MTDPLHPGDAKLLVLLQQGLPIDPRPFARIGESLGMSGEEVLARVRNLFDTGVARRFGAIFDSNSLGYHSTLCAADIPAADLEAAAARIAPHPGITHCYERDGHPNLWFTLTAFAPDLSRELERVQAALGYAVLNLPALRKFKIEAVFGRDETAAPPSPATAQTADRPPLPTERERQVIRHLQASIAVSEDPFGAVARTVGYDPAELLELLARWKASGVIRRIGLVLRHRTLGFSANSMCVWPVPDDRIEAAGRILAGNSHVTHCYERPHTEVFPYNLYAMIHAKSREEAIGVFGRLGTDAGLSGGRMMWSVREFKKSSPIFFCEPTPLPGKPGAG